MSQEPLDPLDLFGVRACLTDEERLVQDSVARFVTSEAMPLIRECFEHHRFPRELIPGLANLGVLGASIQGYDCAGLNAMSYGLICQELERGDSALRSFVSVQSSLPCTPSTPTAVMRSDCSICRAWRAASSSAASA